MTKVNTYLAERLKSASSAASKMASLADMSNAGSLSSFAGVFRVTPLSSSLRMKLSTLLETHKASVAEISLDLEYLCDITAEVRAINSQAVILHGERIKRAQHLLKKYRDGAFTAWLVATYGNRQTPYNFLHYYELYQAIPKVLSGTLDEMPKRIAYILAGRQGCFSQKEEILRNSAGQSKQELLNVIRQSFPLSKNDNRTTDPFDQAITTLQKIQHEWASSSRKPSSAQKDKLREIFQSFLEDCQS